MAGLEAEEQEMSDEQFAEEIRDLVARLNTAAAAAAQAGIALEFLGSAIRKVSSSVDQAILQVKIMRPL